MPAVAQPPNRPQWLIFIDTNILLDFYRLVGDAAERQLQSLSRHKDALILTDQVWMEYLKNRQRVILGTVKDMKKPETVKFPPIVAGLKQAKMVQSHLDRARKSNTKVADKIQSILQDPAKHDYVFQYLKGFFGSESTLSLDRSNKDRYRIRNLARKRFILGYPPRKNDDTSIGDSVNWEWIIQCALASRDNRNVLIVSRDTDFGVTHGNETYLNDWLAREFKARVGRTRKIVLTPRLTEALRKLDENVTPQDEQQEDQLIAATATRRLDLRGAEQELSWQLRQMLDQLTIAGDGNANPFRGLARIRIAADARRPDDEE
jgi:hypothetical protein